ncbi:DUF438 domain-containing protein [candidate division KSB1 bacterium]|nr:MAG: DUF438 domain-containing protein [candidate division KSB1 bacterium]
MSEIMKGRNQMAVNQKEKLKELLRRLHKGENIRVLKQELKQILGSASPLLISQVEQELLNEGLPREQLRQLCEVHLELFSKGLESEKIQVPSSHPVHTFMEEHQFITNVLQQALPLMRKIIASNNYDKVEQEAQKLKDITETLLEFENHNIREENALFPYLEKHGVTEPPAIMWAEHNDFRDKKKKLFALLENFIQAEFSSAKQEIEKLVIQLVEGLPNHFFKENNILYPTALKLLSEQEWSEIKESCDELGYTSFVSERPKQGTERSTKQTVLLEQEEIQLPTGRLTLEELQAVLNSLPVDISFVDKNDTVRYFNQPEERIFPRAVAVLGRKVQNCHPQKSVHVVNQILDDFKSGRKDMAEFWLQIKDKFIHIRYFAVRNAKGEYLGTLEATQDITQIRKLKGHKTLL